MRVMLVTRAWETQRSGGMIHVVADRARELVRQGHDTHVVTTSDTPVAGQVKPAVDREEFGLTTHYVESPGHEWSAAFAEGCYAWAKKLDPDIIHTDSFDRDRVWWFSNFDVSVTMHGFLWGSWLTRWNEYRAFGKVSYFEKIWGTDPAFFPHKDIGNEIEGLKSAKSVIGVSGWEWRMLRDQYGLDAKLVYNPIDPCFFEPWPDVPRSGFLCATISQGGTRGFPFAQDAARRAGVKLETVTKVSRKEMPAIYDRVKAIVLPTCFAQGYDLTVAEARARGTPAIMSPTGSYLEIATPHDRLVSIGDTDMIASAMRSFPDYGSIGFDVSAHRPDAHVGAWLEVVG